MTRGMQHRTSRVVGLVALGALLLLGNPSAGWAATNKWVDDGNIGIGTMSPVNKLHIWENNLGVAGFRVENTASGAGAQIQNVLKNNAGSLAYYGLTSSTYSSAPILANRAFFGSYLVDTLIWTQSAKDILFATGGAAAANERMRILSTGNVGIGTSAPTAKLHVIGDAIVSGNIAAKYQDVAEWVPSKSALLPGTVVIIDPQATNQVLPAAKPYDTRVAGVVSTQPGILLGEAGDDKVKITHSGRVPVKVDASFGPIAAGDLLVTSPTPGYAMLSTPVDLGGVPIHRPGTLVGKALEPLAEGQGEILVLLTLQ